jgi:hypothetical protein
MRLNGLTSLERTPLRSLVSRIAISRIAVCCGLLSLLAVSGCSSIQVGLGMKVHLAKLPVNAMEASLPQNPGIAPGEKSPLVVTLTAPGGKVWVTEGKGKGKILWKDLTVTASVVSVDKKGDLTLARDPRVSDGRTGHIAITVPSHPGLTTEMDIPLRYNYPFTSRFAGQSGTSGSSGSDGQNGISGSPGSIDPDNPSPGGNGTSGTDGSNGGDGGPGGDGLAVQVLMTLRTGSHPLLQIGVTAAGHKERFYLVDPQGGSLTVSSNGGPGGSGGRGGRGGSGGSGGSGTPNGTSGTNGSDGRNGSDGSNGRGGSISVTYDPQVQPFLSTLRLSNAGGPKPDFQEAPVAPLW